MDQTWLKRRILLAVSLAAVLGGAQLCSAAEASEDAMENLELGETVVTATRSKLEEKKVPMAVQVIKADEMKKRALIMSEMPSRMPQASMFPGTEPPWWGTM